MKKKNTYSCYRLSAALTVLRDWLSESLKAGANINGAMLVGFSLINLTGILYSVQFEAFLQERTGI